MKHSYYWSANFKDKNKICMKETGGNIFNTVLGRIQYKGSIPQLLDEKHKTNTRIYLNFMNELSIIPENCKLFKQFLLILI